MSLRSSFVLLTRLLISVSVVSTVYVYLYPLWSGCAFRSTTGSVYDGFRGTVARHTSLTEQYDAHLAPFRLLVLADPQLEGDSSLPDPEDAFTAKLHSHWNDLRQNEASRLPTTISQTLQKIVLDDIPEALWAIRKTVDLFGNDYYLAHIYRTLHWWTKPTHVTVLGDLIGSQWVSDDEFAWRGWRYWNRVFAGSKPVDRSYMTMHSKELDEQEDILLDQEVSDWTHQVINIAGNHDIGYAGDITPSRLARFERVFGELNWDIRFVYPPHLIPENHTDKPVPSIQLIILNSMLLDTPALNLTLQAQTYDYVNDLIQHRLSRVDPLSRDASFTLLLTHVPLNKAEGICVDAPFFDFWNDADDDGMFESGGLKEQNHLSDQVSQSGVLQALFGMTGDLNAAMGGIGRKGLILNGHDHEGCDVMHYIERYSAKPEPSPELGNEGAESLKVGADGPWKDEDFLLPEDVPRTPLSGNTDEHSDMSTPSGPGSDTAASIMTESSDISAESLPSSTSSTSSSISTPTWRWKAVQTSNYPPTESSESGASEVRADLNIALREITLRSMMGSYGGNAGLLSVWFDFSHETWEYEITMCKAGVQHIWWAVHVLDISTLCALLLWAGDWMYQPQKKSVTKRVRVISYVRERPKKTGDTQIYDRSTNVVKQAKAVENLKRAEGLGGSRASQEGGELEKRRVYKHVVR